MVTREQMELKMREFRSSHEDASRVLDAYNEVDPFHVYFGEDTNPDEYIGYAKRFLLSEGATIERVKASFLPSQWSGDWITDAECQKIANLIDG